MDSRIKLAVLFHEGAWRMRMGETFSRPFGSEREAIAAAIRHAHNLGRATDGAALGVNFNDIDNRVSVLAGNEMSQDEPPMWLPAQSRQMANAALEAI